MSTFRHTNTSRWKTAVHEAGHWVFAEWLSVVNVDVVSVVPAGDSAGRISTRRRLHLTFEDVRNDLLMVAAGAAAMNVVTGTRRGIDGSDLHESYQLAEELGDHRLMCVASKVAENLVRGPLWVPVLTCASAVYDLRTIERDLARDIWWTACPDALRWGNVEYRNEIEGMWIAAGGHPTCDCPDKMLVNSREAA